MTNGRSTFLVDTNVLVYGYDNSNQAKQERAITLYESLLAAGTGALSVQILGEFFNASTRRLKPLLTVEAATEAVVDFRRSWRVFDLYPQMVLDAVRAVAAYKLPYFDALIWATAKHNDVPFLLSEDFNTGQLIEGVRIVNPFAPDFDMAILS
jgi:predicted nucleic acid-binding protein